MAYLTVDKYGLEEAHSRSPERYDYDVVEAPYIVNHSGWKSSGRKIRLPQGTVKLLLGRKLSWKSGPAKIEEIKL